VNSNVSWRHRRKRKGTAFRGPKFRLSRSRQEFWCHTPFSRLLDSVARTPPSKFCPTPLEMSATEITTPTELRRLWNLISFQDGIGTNLPLNFSPGSSDIYNINGRPIHIRTVVDPTGENLELDRPNRNIIYIAVHGGGRGGPYSPSCFFLRVNRITRHAHLQGTNRRSDCFKDDKGEDSKLVVMAAYRWARLHGIRTITFTDNTHIYCPDSVELANLSLLTTGRTWYEAAVPGCYPTLPAIKTQLERDKERVRRNSWNSVAGGSPTLWSAFDSTGINTAEPGSAMAVLQRAKLSRTACSAFHHHMAELVTRSGILSYDGRDWIWILPAAKERRITRRRKRTHRL